MASNYRNSAGTDLDDVFYVNNSNAGALGFLCSNGQDLGNRYPSGSLGYNVGYKNSAGTDIGYLRTKLVPPTATSTVATSNMGSDTMYTQVRIEDTESAYYVSMYIAYSQGVLKPTITINNGMSVDSVKWYLQGYSTGFGWADNTRYVYINFSSTKIPSYGYGTSGGTMYARVSNYQKTFGIPKSASSSSVATSDILGTTSSLSTNISFVIIPRSSADDSHIATGSIYLRVRAYISNASGGTWINSSFIRAFYLR